MLASRGQDRDQTPVLRLLLRLAVRARSAWQPYLLQSFCKTPDLPLSTKGSPMRPFADLCALQGCDLVGHGIPQQKLTAYMLDVIRAAEAGILLPARERMVSTALSRL